MLAKLLHWFGLVPRDGMEERIEIITRALEGDTTVEQLDAALIALLREDERDATLESFPARRTR